MDAQIIINSVDQTAYLLSISRSYNYCSVSQEFTIELDLACPTTFNSYDPIVIYEEGVKVLTGYVGTITKKAPEAKLVLKGTDVYVRASDYFVSETYTTDFGQTVSYWCTFLLNLAGLTPIFTDGVGPFVVAEQEIGLSSVADILTQMLQYAGWYGRVDPEGTVIFGKVDKIPLPYQIIEGVNILSDEIDQSYDKTRNKAIVFGGIDTVLNRFEQIISVAEVDMDTLPVDQTVVVGNPLIADQESADDFSQALVNEFAKLTQIKQIKVLGNPNYQAGKFVEVHSDIFTGIALITSMRSDFSESGYTMDLVLDDPCPRIVGAIKHQPELYAGTLGDGVWAYNLYSGAWEDISSGLTNFYINDLSVDNGLFIAATPAGIYTKLASAGWVKQNLPLYSGAAGGTLVYSGVYANLFDNQVNAIVTSIRPDYNYAWLYTGTIASGGNGFRWSGQPIRDFFDTGTYSGEYYSATDIEGNYGTKFISTRWQLDNSVDKTFFVVSGIHLYSMGPYGDNPTPLFQSDGADSYEQPAVSHDGTKLALASNAATPTHHEIYVSNVDGTNSERLTSTGFGAYYPDWSFDDTRIVYVQEFASDAEIFVMNIDGTEQTQVTNGTSSFYKHPRFIDTHKIAYSKVTDPGFYNIYVIDDDGTNEIQLTDNSFDTEMYSYDTGQLRALYTTNEGGTFDDIYRIGTDGNNNELIKSGSEVSAPNLLDDGKFLIYSENGQIFITGLAYLNTEKVTDQVISEDVQNSGFGMLESEKIIFSDGEVRSINIDGTGDTLVSTAVGFLNFSSDRQTFWVSDIKVGAEVGQPNVFHISVGGTSTNEITLDEDEATKEIFAAAIQGHGIAISPNGTELAFFRENDEPENPPTPDYDLYNLSSAGAFTKLTDHRSLIGGANGWKGYSPGGALAYNFNTNVTILNTGSFAGNARGWANTTDTLFYTKNGTSPQELWSYSATGGHAKVYTCDTNYTVESIKVSPNDQFIAVEEFRSTLHTNTIYVSRIGSNTKSTLTGTQSFQSFDVDWTPDSDSVIFRGKIFDSIQNLYVRSIEIKLADGTQPFHRAIAVTPRTRVFQTFDNDNFFLVFEDQRMLLENNVDTYSPLTVYGRDGNWYATDFMTYSGTIASGLITYDVAARSINTEKQLFATTSQGIYKTIVSGQPVLKNSIGAREIVTRYYGSGEIFFSVGAEVKQSLTECSTYTDISSGLPGTLITVLRLDR